MPSTWPWTMWPPSLSEGRSASSRLTRSPASSAPSEVSGERLLHRVGLEAAVLRASTAVRQAPLTATESPAAISRGEPGRDPEPGAVGAGARPPRPCPSVRDQAGEHRLPLPQPGADQHVLADRLASTSSARRASATSRARALEQRRAPARRSARGATKRRSSSISPASKKAPASVGPPSSSRLVTPRRPSSSSAAREPLRRSRPAATDLGAGASQRRRRGRARRRRRRRRAAAPRRACATSCESSGSRALESKTTRAGWRAAVDLARGQQRVVGERGADPDRDGVGLGAPAVHQRAALGRRRSSCESPGGASRPGRRARSPSSG